MEKWYQALVALGGFAAIGGLIDLAMYKSEKTKLKAKLEDWWLRFDDVKWSNFGRKEAELAIQILDRWAGPRLWSWRRWLFSVSISVLMAGVAMLWTELLIVLQPPEARSESGVFTLRSYIVFSIISMVVTFALSLTLTRFVAVYVALNSNSMLRSVSLFLLLLFVHLVLLLHWSQFVELVRLIPWTAYLVDARSFYWSELYLRVGDIWQLALDRLLDDPFEFRLPRRWASFYSFPDRPWFDWADIYSSLMDFIGNGIRIAFALVFLSSFVFRALIQEPISRLWYGAMDSGRTVFTTLFGILGAVVAAVHVLAT